jgi:hypothetical protein
MVSSLLQPQYFLEMTMTASKTLETKLLQNSTVFWDIMLCSLITPTFQRNVLLPSSGAKSKPRKKPARNSQHVESQEGT